MSTVEKPSAARFVGARVQRREDPRLLSGHGQYVDDVRLPGMLHATFVRSPLARARIVGIDLEHALAVPGVVAIWDGSALNGDAATPLWNWGGEGTPFPEVRALAEGDVRFAGDPVAIVIARDRYVAEDAAELVDVEYEALEAVVGRELAEHSSARAHDGIDTNLAWSAASPADPALEAAFAASAHVITETFRQQRHVNVPMEPRGLVAHWERGAEQLTVYASSQNPHQDREYFARVMGLPEHHVRVIMRDVGGGFGQKIFRTREETAVAFASRRLGRPVKWIEDRQENLMAANHARDEQMTLRVGVDADGVITAIHASYLADVGAYPLMPAMMPGFMALQVLPGPYRFARYGWAGRSVFTNTSGISAYRGPWMMETVAREIMMDVVAREIGVDPAEIRRRNVIQTEDLPYTTPTGREYDRISPAQTLEAALEEIGYDRFREEQERARAEGRYLGLGISTYIEPTAGAQGPTGIEAATVRVEPSGKVNVLMGTGSHGHSLETTMVQVVADQLGVPIEDVRLLQGDTAVSPYGGGTAGSRSAVIAGGVARISAIKLREKVLELAGHLLEAAAADLEIEDGTIAVKGSPGSSIAFADVARIAYYDASRLPEGMEPGLEITSRYHAPPATYANSTQVCTCEVDIATGEVRLLDYVVGEDCGVMINPMVVEGQIAGGVAQGIGGALLEHLAYDETGNPLAVTFKDYLLPTTEDVPDIRYVHVETPSNTPGGHKGVGEGGAIGAPAAVVNAVADALAPLGVRVTSQPLSPDRVLAMIDESGVPHALGR
jgi:carbon-monoxide dehydrogenase large subunit